MSLLADITKEAETFPTNRSLALGDHAELQTLRHTQQLRRFEKRFGIEVTIEGRFSHWFNGSNHRAVFVRMGDLFLTEVERHISQDGVDIPLWVSYLVGADPTVSSAGDSGLASWEEELLNSRHDDHDGSDYWGNASDYTLHAFPAGSRADLVRIIATHANTEFAADGVQAVVANQRRSAITFH